jgi:hypothetical protein
MTEVNMEIQPREDLGTYEFTNEARISTFLSYLLVGKETIFPLNLHVTKGSDSERPPWMVRLIKMLSESVHPKSGFLRAVEILGIKNDANAVILDWHEKRLNTSANLALQTPYLIVIAISTLILLASDRLPDPYARLLSSNVFFQVYLFTGLIIGFRITSLITRKYYADSLCARNGLYLMLELLHPHGLSTPTHRKRIQGRLNYLANNVSLLAHRYKSTSSANEQKINERFETIEQYIRERERWVVLPKESTITKLRKDFSLLLPILINGNYGEFAFPAWEKQSSIEKIPSWRKVASGILGLLGIVVPTVSLYTYYVSGTLKIADNNAATFTAVMVAWLILTLDTILKLGLIETFANLVKSVRELR